MIRQLGRGSEAAHYHSGSRQTRTSYNQFCIYQERSTDPKWASSKPILLRQPPFIILAVLAVLFLHGILIADGAFLALLKTIAYGTFSDGTPRYLVNTGNNVLDLLLAQCVSFWTPVVSKSPASLLISTTLCASLQTVAVWATIEGLRVCRNKHAMLRLAPLTIFFWQYVGTSIVLPLYAVVELRQHFEDGVGGKPKNIMALPYAAAQALIPSAVIALVHPFFTIHYTPSGTTEAQLQTFVANYHLAGPLY
ncbi:hypothetical protein F5Y19DRAFT_481644 [Xylariaceae sp. FL1651]|nr:hypothetical protein F5Y19DRAFT_481644 [Xylariaceae sp. FL1651]